MISDQEMKKFEQDGVFKAMDRAFQKQDVKALQLDLHLEPVKGPSEMRPKKA